MKVPQLQCIELHDIFPNLQASVQLHRFQNYQEPTQPEEKAIAIISQGHVKSAGGKARKKHKTWYLLTEAERMQSMCVRICEFIYVTYVNILVLNWVVAESGQSSL